MSTTMTSVSHLSRLAGNIPQHITEQTVGPTIAAFTNGVEFGSPATTAGTHDCPEHIR